MQVELPLQPPEGPLPELLKPASGTRELFQTVGQAHRSWDGREPDWSL